MKRTKLLVSVRDEFEAEAALCGGANLIDVKDPDKGSLGKAADDVIRAIARQVVGQVPLSAALGEWDANATWPTDVDLDFVKWGPAEARRNLPGWRAFMRSCFGGGGTPQPVVVAYADWECAQAPDIDEIVAFACQNPGSVLLIDTHCKDNGAGLLDWLPVASVLEICDRCRRAEVRIALAGSIGASEIRQLASARPDWFAVRGAVCAGSDRTSSISAERVGELATLIRALNP